MRYKRGCDLSVYSEKKVLFRLYLVLYWRDLTENSHLTLSAYALQKIVTLVAIEQMLRASYLKVKVLFLLYLSFHWRDLIEYSYFAFYTHALKHLVCDRSINKGTYLENKVTFRPISASFGGIFLKLYHAFATHALLML